MFMPMVVYFNLRFNSRRIDRMFWTSSANYERFGIFLFFVIFTHRKEKSFIFLRIFRFANNFIEIDSASIGTIQIENLKMNSSQGNFSASDIAFSNNYSNKLNLSKENEQKFGQQNVTMAQKTNETYYGQENSGRPSDSGKI